MKKQEISKIEVLIRFALIVAIYFIVAHMEYISNY